MSLIEYMDEAEDQTLELFAAVLYPRSSLVAVATGTSARIRESYRGVSSLISMKTAER